MADRLLNEDGEVYEKGAFTGNWNRQTNWLGSPERETDWLGRPQIEKDWLGRPVEEKTVWGNTVTGTDGRPLFRPAISSSPSSSSSGADAGAAILGTLLVFGLVVVAVIAIGAILKVLFQLLTAIVEGYVALVRRHPRAMLVFHLCFFTAAVAGGLYLAGFAPWAQAAGAGLVPLLWLWQRLTRRLPLVFMPINAILLGIFLWWISSTFSYVWMPDWSRLTAGIPMIWNLPLVLGVLPLVLLLFGLVRKRWPLAGVVVGCIAAGSALCFVLMRVWPAWQPYWMTFVAPVPFMPPVAWLIFLAPLLLWLWQLGSRRWPLPFGAGNLLLLGGLFGLIAYHTRPQWDASWRYWTVGTPLLSAPLVAITLAPVALWGWVNATRRWTRWLVLPNLVLTGLVFWWFLERLRVHWEPSWLQITGHVPFTPDLPLLVLLLPPGLWGAHYIARHWPTIWPPVRALLLGVVLWWLTERLREFWETGWVRFAGPAAPDLAVIALALPPGLWLWHALSKRWPKVAAGLGWAAVTLTLLWLAGLFLPESTLIFRISLALLPLALRGWGWLLHKRPALTLACTLLPCVALDLWIWQAPASFEPLLVAAVRWLAAQGLPAWEIYMGL